MQGELTNKERLVQIHTALVGMDGLSGMVGDLGDAKDSRKAMHTKQDEMEKQLQAVQTRLETQVMTKNACGEQRKEDEEAATKDEQWTWQKKVWVNTIRFGGIAAVTAVAGFLLSLARGRG